MKNQKENQKENQNEKSKSILEKAVKSLSDLASNPKVVDGFNFAKSGYKCYEVYDAYKKNDTDNFLQNKAIDFISNETATALVSGIGSLIPALGTGFLPVVGVFACSYLIYYGLSKL